MRTWKQGRIGKIPQPDGGALYVKCLRYPVARFYGTYDGATGMLDDFRYEAEVSLSSFGSIETIGQQKLTGEEKARGNRGNRGNGPRNHSMTSRPM